MFGLSPLELILILVAALLLFGARRLPEIAKGIGKGIREFRGAMKETTAELKGGMDEEPAAPPAAAPKPAPPAETAPPAQPAPPDQNNKEQDSQS